jgi:hypothetical protein
MGKSRVEWRGVAGQKSPCGLEKQASKKYTSTTSTSIPTCYDHDEWDKLFLISSPDDPVP